MTPMKKYAQFAVLAGLVVGLASFPAFAVQNTQSSGQQAQPERQSGTQTAPAAQGATQGASQAQPAQPARPAVPQLDPAEEKAYKAFYDTPNTQPQEIINSGESFVKKYPNSRYNVVVYSRLTAAYEDVGDSTKMFDAGHKALQLNPDNVDILSLMAYAIPRRIQLNDLETPRKLQEATQDADHALDLLSKMQKPANLTDQQFTTAVNAEAASCHSGLGLVDYYQHNIAGMVAEFQQAVKLDPTPDPADQYLLGLAYLQSGRASDAEGVLQQCSAEAGPLETRCQTAFAQAKKMAASAPAATPAKP
jgi:tetratricopeptide (TPR) repeat protein